ncbi:MAG: catalase [Kofleriaceae bacterium]
MPATDWKELIPPDEDKRFEYFTSVLTEIQAKAQSGRALHAKGNLGAEAEFEVLADVPADARHGMFDTPKKYPALVRYSNGAPRKQHDKKPDVRGIAIKVIGVAGEKAIPGMEAAVTQDFLAIRTPATPVRDAEEFIKLVRAAQTPALLPFKLIGSLGLKRALQVIKGALGGFKLPTAKLASTTYYAALPSQLGPFAIQYVVRPQDPHALAKKGGDLGEELAARLREGPVVYDLCVTFFTDENATPIEDASVEWKGALIPVARVTLLKQDIDSARGKVIAEYIERAAFDPWHCRKDMKPLGNMMRARNHAYRASTRARNAAPEPAEMPTFSA